MDAVTVTIQGEGVKDFMFILLLIIFGILVFLGGIDAFVAFNLWLGELMGMGYK